MQWSYFTKGKKQQHTNNVNMTINMTINNQSRFHPTQHSFLSTASYIYSFRQLGWTNHLDGWMSMDCNPPS